MCVKPVCLAYTCLCVGRELQSTIAPLIQFSLFTSGLQVRLILYLTKFIFRHEVARFFRWKNTEKKNFINDRHTNTNLKRIYTRIRHSRVSEWNSSFLVVLNKKKRQITKNVSKKYLFKLNDNKIFFKINCTTTTTYYLYNNRV